MPATEHFSSLNHQPEPLRERGRLGLDRVRVEISSADPAPPAIRQQMLAFLDEHPDALVRTCLTGHFTGSALVVDDDTGKVLLLHHAKLRRWLQPGGHADGEGDLGAVALREASEETGLTDLVLVRPAIDLDMHAIPARGAEPAHLHLDVRYLVLATMASAVLINEESTASRWVDPRGERHLLASHELRRLVDAGLARLAQR